MANYIYDPDTDELIPTNSVKGKLLVEQARLKANAVVQSAGSEMSGGGVSSKPMGAPDINRPNIIEGRTATDTQVAADEQATDTQAADAQAAAVAQATADAQAAATAAAAAEAAAQQAINDAKNAAELAAANAALAAAKTAADAAAKAAKEAAARAAADAAAAAATAANAKSYTATDGTEFTDQNAFATYQSSLYATNATTQLEKDKTTAERKSAYSLLESEFKKYGLEKLALTVKDLIINGTPTSEATMRLRATTEYQTRFAGNTMLLKAGKNVYTESTYLDLENDMQESFKAYGVQNLLGATREQQQKYLSTFIGEVISPLEVKRRLKTSVEEVRNRPDILRTFQKYYPSIEETDIVSYFLDPKQTETRLNAKVQASQIGSAAARQGLVSNVLTSEDLAALRVSEDEANLGYAKIARDLPTLQKYGNIEGQDVGQTNLEDAYLKNLSSEQRKIDQATQRERDRFAASAGNAPGAYSTGYLKKSSAAGLI